MPSVAAELDRYATLLERHHADMCDIEFTIEGGTLWLLQCRIGKRSPGAALRIAVDMAEADDFPLTRAEAVGRVARILVDPPSVATGRATDAVAMATGLPASPGLVSGEIATTPEAAIAVAEAGRPVILVRSETSPDDVHGMAKAAGLLTSSGGLASHAAVVARGWGIPAVVGAGAVLVGDDGISIGGRRFAVGSSISIDGSNGEIFDGVVVGSVVIVPEAAKLQGWARELGITIGDGETADTGSASAGATGPSASTPQVTDASLPATRDDVLGLLAIKGYGTPPAVAEALFATPEEIRPLLDGLIADGLVEAAADAFRLAPQGKEVASQGLADDRDRWGTDRAATALDAFMALDQRMKATVTAWQVREDDGPGSLNDHTDAAYDARVIAQLEALNDDAVAWHRATEAPIGRFKLYIARLDRAARLASAGDPRYIASPRVDSYHGVWFELHEDLILLSGRTRAEEVAAGRA
jgi:pyruvate,orthophosphate dikinase